MTDQASQDRFRREIQAQHEKEVQGLTQLIKQAEKDLASAQMEINHYKSITHDFQE